MNQSFNDQLNSIQILEQLAPLQPTKDHLPGDIIDILERLGKADNIPHYQLYYIAENYMDHYYSKVIETFVLLLKRQFADRQLLLINTARSLKFLEEYADRQVLIWKIFSKHENIPDDISDLHLHIDNFKSNIQKEFNFLKEVTHKNIENFQASLSSQQTYLAARGSHINNIYHKILEIQQQLPCPTQHMNTGNVIKIDALEFNPDIDGGPSTKEQGEIQGSDSPIQHLLGEIKKSEAPALSQQVEEEVDWPDAVPVKIPPQSAQDNDHNISASSTRPETNYSEIPQLENCMSPDNEYVSLIMYTITIEIDLCNFLAIWAVLSILLDTQSNTLPHVKSFQQVVNNYYDKCPTDVMSELEQQASSIMKAMYDSVNNEHSDSVSGDLDRVSDAVDSDYDVNDYDKDENVMPYDKDENVMPYNKDDNVMPYDKDENVMPNDREKHEMPHDSDNEYMPDDNDDDKMPAKYDNDSETVTDEMKHDDNMNSYEQIDVGKKDVVTYNRTNRILTKEKRPIETKDIDDDFMRKYDEMYKSMEYKQTRDYYEARRHIQSATEGDTPIKTGQNRQCIDNVRDYDREYNRILNSVYHTLDLGPNMLPGAQQYTTVESAPALSIQEKIKGKNDENIHNENGQYRNEWYKRAENMVPQLDGTYYVSDDSDSDSHSYLDLVCSNIITHRT